MDRRVKYTKNIIKDTFLELLNDKDINDVTVVELCNKADINRATFYRYYLDIFDLLEKLEDEFVSELKEAYKDFSMDSDLYDYVLALLKTCCNNKRFTKILFKSKNSIMFLNEILEDAYLRCKDKWERNNYNLSEDDEELATIYLFNGTIGIVNYWVLSDFNKNIEEVAHSISSLGYYGINKFIYKK